jgi:hypothetical protein
MPIQLLSLCCNILKNFSPSDPFGMFERFQHDLMADFLHKQQTDEDAIQNCVLHMNELLGTMEMSLQYYPELLLYFKHPCQGEIVL